MDAFSTPQDSPTTSAQVIGEDLTAGIPPLQQSFVYAQRPRVEIVYNDHSEPIREWDNQLFQEQRGTWRVTGAAGAGVSTLLMDTVAERIRRGVSPESIIVVAASRESAARLRAGIAHRIADGSYTSPASLVRSVHSLAFALLRSLSDEQLRLITGAEQDAVIRELLQGHVDNPSLAAMWPAEARQALGLIGFAREVRDFLLRSGERGLEPEDLEELGARYGRPMWASAGKFMREYQQVMNLGGTHSLNASELVSKLLCFDIPDMGWRTIIIDDAQHLDPQSAQLLQALMRYTDFTVIAGDPQQSVFHFRGASPEFLLHAPVDHELTLYSSFRQPTVEAKVLGSTGDQSEFVADLLRRSHLLEGIRWNDMAVIVRSTADIPSLRRALLSAGVPVQEDPSDIILSEQRIVSALILAVRAIYQELSAQELEELALGPIGGADTVTLRRLFRGLRKAEMHAGGNRRAIEIMRELIDPKESEEQTQLREQVEAVLTDRELAVVDKIRAVLVRGAQPGSVEEILWEIWDASALSSHLQTVSLRGGVRGAQADRDLDAVMALFDAAGDWVERRPTASITSFVRHIAEQELPTGVRDRRLATADAVRIVTAHGSLGQQWHTVIVAGVQEGTWPSLQETGTLFGQEDLIDLIDSGIEPNTYISRSAEKLKEEKRLFHVARTRGTHRVVITAVESPESDTAAEPSRFLQGIAESKVQGPTTDPETASVQSEIDTETVHLDQYVRLLSVPSIVAELRRELANPDSPQRRREQAARQLARLALHQVPGARPEQWWGYGGPSETTSLDISKVSPSLIENALLCPLRARLERLVEEENTPIHMLKGTLAHAFAEAVGRGVDPNEAEQLVTQAFEALLDAPAWSLPHHMSQWSTMLQRLAHWIDVSHAQRELVGVEVPVNVAVAPGVELRGRIDRLERNDAGEFHIVDFKTGKQAVTKDEANENKQLLAYQLALHRGELMQRNGEPAINTTAEQPGLTVDQAVLVYPATDTKTVTTREQAPKDAEELEKFSATLPALLESLSGPQLVARINTRCDQCKIKTMCPAQPEGKMVPEC
ncbi:ATP-dependent helicase [Corynebacterium diphtheriae]|nr:ATP-dependent helicase [Corynebacterium diphtheriae]CAB0835752.1 ATP-dependent helicase [Corynebacterium diphtheriae]